MGYVSYYQRIWDWDSPISNLLLKYMKIEEDTVLTAGYRAAMDVCIVYIRAIIQ